MKTIAKTAGYNPAMSRKDLAALGAEKVAYIRSISSNEVMEKFPVVEGLQPGRKLWALFAANGDPLALSDEPGQVLSNAHDLNLLPITLH